MDSSRKSNKIRDIVRLQQILKKWKKLASSNSSSTSTTTTTTTRSIKFLKKTLSFSESSSSSALANAVPKGYIAVCVGKELKRFVIPTEYLRHQVFGILLREAEEEFGFQQEGVLKFPCEVDLFKKVLKMMEDKRSLSSPSLLLLHDDDGDDDDHDDDDDHNLIINCSNNYSPDIDHEHLSTPSHHHHPQMCR